MQQSSEKRAVAWTAGSSSTFGLRQSALWPSAQRAGTVWTELHMLDGLTPCRAGLTNKFCRHSSPPRRQTADWVCRACVSWHVQAAMMSKPLAPPAATARGPPPARSGKPSAAPAFLTLAADAAPLVPAPAAPPPSTGPACMQDPAASARPAPEEPPDPFQDALGAPASGPQPPDRLPDRRAASAASTAPTPAKAQGTIITAPMAPSDVNRNPFLALAGTEFDVPRPGGRGEPTSEQQHAQPQLPSLANSTSIAFQRELSANPHSAAATPPAQEAEQPAMRGAAAQATSAPGGAPALAPSWTTSPGAAPQNHPGAVAAALAALAGAGDVRQTEQGLRGRSSRSSSYHGGGSPADPAPPTRRSSSPRPRPSTPGGSPLAGAASPLALPAPPPGGRIGLRSASPPAASGGGSHGGKGLAVQLVGTPEVRGPPGPALPLSPNALPASRNDTRPGPASGAAGTGDIKSGAAGGGGCEGSGPAPQLDRPVPPGGGGNSGAALPAAGSAARALPASGGSLRQSLTQRWKTAAWYGSGKTA